MRLGRFYLKGRIAVDRAPCVEARSEAAAQFHVADRN
jgi:hypothetical protein